MGAITAQTSAVLAHGISWYIYTNRYQYHTHDTCMFGFGEQSEYGIGICWYSIGMFDELLQRMVY